MSNNTPTAWTMFRCPFCGDDCLTTQQRTTQQGEVFFRVVCASCGSRGPNASDAVQAIASWNRRAQPSMSPHHPCDTLTARDELLCSDRLFTLSSFGKLEVTRQTNKRVSEGKGEQP